MISSILQWKKLSLSMPYFMVGAQFVSSPLIKIILSSDTHRSVIGNLKLWPHALTSWAPSRFDILLQPRFWFFCSHLLDGCSMSKRNDLHGNNNMFPLGLRRNQLCKLYPACQQIHMCSVLWVVGNNQWSTLEITTCKNQIVNLFIEIYDYSFLCIELRTFYIWGCNL